MSHVRSKLVQLLITLILFRTRPTTCRVDNYHFGNIRFNFRRCSLLNNFILDIQAPNNILLSLGILSNLITDFNIIFLEIVLTYVGNYFLLVYFIFFCSFKKLFYVFMKIWCLWQIIYYISYRDKASIYFNHLYEDIPDHY